MPADLDGLDALVIPGGESTVMTLGIEREGLAEPLRELVAPRHAGARHLRRADHARPRSPRRDGHRRRAQRVRAPAAVLRGRPRRRGVTGGPVHAVFIRAPWVAEHGPGVEVLGSVDGHPVAVRQGNVIAVAFHPELAGETRLHELLLAMTHGDR